MSIQSNGMICDVCGQRIEWRSGFFGIRGEQYHVFKNMIFSDKMMHCHAGKCRDLLIELNKTHEFEILPVESPIRKAIENYKPLWDQMCNFWSKEKL